MRWFPSLIVGFAVLGSSFLPASAQTPRYTVEFLGTASSATAVNSFGQVVGNSPLAPANERGWVARSGAPLTPLPLPAGRVSSRVHAINDAGVIAGVVSSATYADPNFGGVAAIWTPTPAGGYTIQELGTLPGDIGSAAIALNDAGDVVGHSQGGTYRRAVWFNSPTGLLDLTPTGAFDPVGINDQRLVVCYSTNCSRLNLNTMVLQNLGAPVGSYVGTVGRSINSSGQVAGAAILSTSTTCDRQAARYTDGIGWEIFTGCGPVNGTGSINDLGDVTLWANTTAYVRLEGLGTFRTEDLIVAPVGHWFLFNGTGLINDARQIVTAGSNSSTGQSGVLLLTPWTSLGTPTCLGDGSSGNCPCSNASAAGTLQGCRHSAGTGATLSATGSAAVSAADLVLHVAAAPPNKSAVFFQGVGGTAVPFRDGLRCASNPSVRIEAFQLDGSGSGSSSVSIAARGGVVSGMTRVYQVWFRDPLGPCGSTSNLSAGLGIDWQ